MQQVVDAWEGVAKSTGGALEPSKCWWYLIHFEWNGSDWSYGSNNTILYDTITARDASNTRRDLTFIESSQAQEMLGVFLSPDGQVDKGRSTYYSCKSEVIKCIMVLFDCCLA